MSIRSIAALLGSLALATALLGCSESDRTRSLESRAGEIAGVERVQAEEVFGSSPQVDVVLEAGRPPKDDVATVVEVLEATREEVAEAATLGFELGSRGPTLQLRTDDGVSAEQVRDWLTVAAALGPVVTATVLTSPDGEDDGEGDGEGEVPQLRVAVTVADVPDAIRTAGTLEAPTVQQWGFAVAREATRRAPNVTTDAPDGDLARLVEDLQAAEQRAPGADGASTRAQRVEVGTEEHGVAVDLVLESDDEGDLTPAEVARGREALARLVAASGSTRARARSSVELTFSVVARNADGLVRQNVTWRPGLRAGNPLEELLVELLPLG